MSTFLKDCRQVHKWTPTLVNIKVLWKWIHVAIKGFILIDTGYTSSKHLLPQATDLCVCSVILILILLLGHYHRMCFRFLVESTCVTYACAKLVSWMWTGVTTLETLQSPENKIQPDFYTDNISDLLAVKKVASAWWWCLQDWWTWLHSLILMWIISTLWCWTWKHITSDASCGEKIDN